MIVVSRWRRAGIRELLKSPMVQRDLRARAQRIANAAGPGMEVRTDVGRNRARAAVVTADVDAMLAEATDRKLTRAIDAGRG